jgi:hypothetical protein
MLPWPSEGEIRPTAKPASEHGHPQRQSRDAVEVTFKVSYRDPRVRAGLAFRSE